jgi:ubiquitin carboxyl-terminal hydrolase 14
MSWSSIKELHEGALFMMIGSKEISLPAPPQNQIVFLEDMNNDTVATKLNLPAGLKNLGNTCYMNSTLQCLRLIPELFKNIIVSTSPNNTSSSSSSVAQNQQPQLEVALAAVIKDMSTSETVTPLFFMTLFRAMFPMFADRSHEQYIQQDAEEAWNTLLAGIESATPLRRALGIEFETTTTRSDVEKTNNEEKNSSSEELQEPPVIGSSNDLRITCHLATTNVHNLQLCILASLTQKIEKRSEVLRCEVPYTIKSQISRLPKYLSVHFARFMWRNDIKERVKIRKARNYTCFFFWEFQLTFIYFSFGFL